MKKATIFIIIFLFGFILFDGISAPKVWAQKTIKVGIPNSLTGRHSPFGQHMKRAFDLALDEINAAGGVKGRPIEWVHVDDQSKPETALTAAQKLFQDLRLLP